MAKRNNERRDNPARSKRTPFILLAGVGGLVLMLVGLMLALRPDAVAPASGSGLGPEVAVDQEVIDFGQVPVEQMVHAEFAISNTGDQPLEIIGVPAVEVREGC